MSHALAFNHARSASAGAPACCAAPATVIRPAIAYDDAIEAEVGPLAALLDTLPRTVRPGTRWLAINLLEGAVTPAQVVDAPAVAELAAAVTAAQARLAAAYGDDLPIAVADGRYQFAHQVAQQVVSGRTAAPTRSDRIDRVLTHPWLGLVLFAAIMYVTFNLVQAVASPYV
ncbi:MAG: hypothetical protein KDD83_01785, partial [Caldilineaceae bacterium]|nr:hypothetical protein [Caldilineaceae bacterium]